MNELEKLARNAGMLSGRAPRIQPRENTEYANRQLYPYLADATQKFIEDVGELACNCFEAECQGIFPEDFYKYGDVLVRTVSASGARTGEIMPDEWQSIEIVKPAITDALRPGAYIKFAGNTWVVYKGLNIGSVTGDGIVRRCNFVIKTLDFYGNIIEVPASFSKMGTLANSPRTSENSIVAKNYMAAVTQLNSVSKSFAENTRFILGKTAYAMRGLNNFTREFTEDEGSIHLLTFTMERAQLLDCDNVEKGVADYNEFKWDLRFDWNSQMNVGETQQIEVKSVRNGKPAENTSEQPVTYRFESSNPDIAKIDANGRITAVSEGSAEITVTLNQNPEINRTISIKIANTGTTFIAFTNTAIKTLREYDECIISAAVYRNGQATAEPIDYTFSGPDKICFSAKDAGNNSVKIKCYAASNNVLKITARSGELTAEMNLRLTTG